ncbi:MAG TPA: KUP/HAK/KT family potassium transporter [Stellaceae bacterium]|nr:KUP/HAK/KT family potassium transporter [Stellaceae bacterium]
MTDVALVPEAKPASAPISRPFTAGAALTALGIVYGDLGTSPLYTLSAIIDSAGGEFSPDIGLGILSLVFWALIVTVSVKYCLFVMRADNHGEGGILALMSLVAGRGYGRAPMLVMMGLFGAALIYGDGIITPAISVLSALEGVNVASHTLAAYVMPVAIGILIVLFAAQSRGTARIGAVFGPVMLTWFLVIAVLGIGGIIRHPGVLAAVDPLRGIWFLAHGGWKGLAILGGVFLAMTGGEALYADMGHVGRNPIRWAWYGLVLPALLLNYAGQVALLIAEPGQGSPFFRLAPDWAIYPMVVLATVATIIASQAIITGSFSLTRQAMQLGWFPGFKIRQTSDTEYGQIYVPVINWSMMAMTVLLAASFGSSDRLAGAYGTAVSTTMMLTTALLYRLMRDGWHWPRSLSLAVTGVFLVVDLAFFLANLMKIGEGGWVPLVFGALVFIIMTTWHAGITAVQNKQAALSMQPRRFRTWLRRHKIARVPGTAIFLTRTTDLIPAQIIAMAEQFRSLPETVVSLTLSFEETPRVQSDKRIELKELFDGFWQITVRYGFIEVPNLPAVLKTAKLNGCPIDLPKAVYFSTRDRVIRDRANRHLWSWQVPLFSFLFRNAVRAVDIFNLPPQNFVELSRQIEL